jgi:heat shock protein HslJ
MNKTPSSIILILFAFALILSACTTQPASLAHPNLTGTSWTLISYGSVADQSPAVAGIPTRVAFAPNGRISGNLGCNGFSGNYNIKDGKLEFGALTSTLMACPDTQMVQEGIAFQVLAGTVSFSLAGDLLTVYDSTGKFALKLSRVVN